jgi:hypothetical protein
MKGRDGLEMGRRLAAVVFVVSGTVLLIPAVLGVALTLGLLIAGRNCWQPRAVVAVARSASAAFE